MMRYACLMLLGVAFLVQGCAIFGYTAATVAGTPRVPAAYKLEEFPVLVMVDDPESTLGAPGMTSQIAEMIGFYIREHKEKLKDDDFIPAARLSALADRLGREDGYPQTPIDVIGKELDAKEVICVVMESVRSEIAPGMLRPRAVLAVTVVDVEEGRQVYPETGVHRLEVELNPIQGDRAGRATSRLASRKLAEDISVKVAKLFYKHWEEEPRR